MPTGICGTRGCIAFLAMIAAGVLAPPVSAQDATMTPISTPPQRDAIPLGTGPLPGNPAPESWYHQYGKNFARNVTIATLTPFLPDASKATGTAVIVAPGGGFRSQSMENEGSDVARALAAKGVAAFVLKYRLIPTPPDIGAFEQSMAQMFAGAGRPRGGSAAPSLAPQLA